MYVWCRWQQTLICLPPTSFRPPSSPPLLPRRRRHRRPVTNCAAHHHQRRRSSSSSCSRAHTTTPTSHCCKPFFLLGGLDDRDALLHAALLTEGLDQGLVGCAVLRQHLVGLHHAPAREAHLLVRAHVRARAGEERLQRHKVVLAAAGVAELKALAHRARHGHHRQRLQLLLLQGLGGPRGGKVVAGRRVVELHLAGRALAGVAADGEAQRVTHEEMRGLVADPPLVEVRVGVRLEPLDGRRNDARRSGAHSQEEDGDDSEEVGQGGAHVAADDDARAGGQDEGAQADHHQAPAQVVLVAALQGAEVLALDARR
mmetsp:Transcript_12128/g.19506  ORF Transcript_12128/g.19506 Transcript_12128/m.19506 type:complete len:314 (+) Transcript_12128:417-1358(+)